MASPKSNHLTKSPPPNIFTMEVRASISICIFGEYISVHSKHRGGSAWGFISLEAAFSQWLNCVCLKSQFPCVMLGQSSEACSTPHRNNQCCVTEAVDEYVQVEGYWLEGMPRCLGAVHSGRVGGHVFEFLVPQMARVQGRNWAKDGGELPFKYSLPHSYSQG